MLSRIFGACIPKRSPVPVPIELRGCDNTAFQDQLAFRLAQEFMCRPEDLVVDCSFDDYRVPNEGTPRNVKPHLDLMEKGWIVSVGTERSFYDLLLSPEDRCEGLIIRDIHPRVKAYNDFLILLLFCAKNREDFCALSEPQAALVLLKQQIATRMRDVQIPPAIRDYFLNNFELLANAYLYVHSHLPSEGDNTGIEYWADDTLFARLQNYARAGKIISTLGDINDLEFVSDKRISIIDTSNVSDYIPIGSNSFGDATPRIIFTLQNSQKTIYYSTVFDNVGDKQKIEKIRQYWRLFESAMLFNNFVSIMSMSMPMEKKSSRDRFDSMPDNFLTKENVLKIRRCFIYLIEEKLEFSWCIKSCLTTDARSALSKFIENKATPVKAELDASDAERILVELLQES